MWSKSVKISSNASAEQIWKLWKDVSNWSQWDEDVLESSLKGGFRLGAKGMLRPKSGPKSNFVLTEVTANKSFTTRAKLPFGHMNFTHHIVENDKGLELIHGVEISGPLTFLFSKVIGEKLIDGLPSTLETLSAKAIQSQVHVSV